jgi:ribosomal protein S18 acetylase RimI-like enzyme
LAGRCTVNDAAGRPALVFSEDERSGRPWADGAWRPPTASAATCADVVVRRLPGWALSSSDRELVEELRRRGGVLVRHAHSMSHDLTVLPEPPVEGFAVTPLTPPLLAARAAEVGDVAWRSYPAELGDHDWADVAAAAGGMRAVSAGDVLGPMSDASRIALDGSGGVLGACLVVDRGGPPPHGGHWVLDVFRDPRAPQRGIGAALIAAALRSLAAGSAPALGLAVTHANERALRLYRRLGFTDIEQSWTLHLPG